MSTPKKISKREILQKTIGQARLMEIIDQSYENAGSCENCKALSEWWEKFGAEIPRPEVMPNVQKARKR